MSFSAFIRRILCIHAKSPSHATTRTERQSRHRKRVQTSANSQLPAPRWCDSSRHTSRRAAATAAPNKPIMYRTQDLVPAKILRKPVNGNHVPVEETLSATPKPLAPLPRLPKLISEGSSSQSMSLRSNSSEPPIKATVLSPRSRNSVFAPRLPSPIPHIETTLEARQVKEVITIIGKCFPHIPCAVTGLAAMVHHGFTKRLPKEVSLAFPSRYCDVVRSWALSQGLLEIRGKPNRYGVTLADGQLRCVRARFYETGFESLGTVRTGDRDARANVLNLSTIAVHVARGYVSELGTATQAQQSMFAGDMRWVLRKMERGGLILGTSYARDISQDQFWVPFTLSFPDTLPLFANVGLGLHEVEDLQNESLFDA